LDEELPDTLPIAQVVGPAPVFVATHAGLAWDPENYLSSLMAAKTNVLLAKSEPDDAANAEILA
jgi:hypothetical protein